MVPGARTLLGTAPLGALDLAAIGAGVLGPLLVNEATKPPYRAPQGGEDADDPPAEHGGQDQFREEASA